MLTHSIRNANTQHMECKQATHFAVVVGAAVDHANEGVRAKRGTVNGPHQVTHSAPGTCVYVYVCICLRPRTYMCVCVNTCVHMHMCRVGQNRIYAPYMTV